MTEITRREDGKWWFEMYGDEVGPYDTKNEAKDALWGLQRFYKDNPEYKNSNPVVKEREMNAAIETKKRASKKVASKSADKPKAARKKTSEAKKPVVKAADGTNPFASKLDASAGEKIEKLYLEGKSWKEIAATMDVSVSSIRFRFLDYLIKATYDKKEAE